MKTKIDFITDLLSNKKLHTSQKERLFSLVAEDLKGDKEEIKKIWEEIDKIKEIDNKNESIVQEKKQTVSVVNDHNDTLIQNHPKLIKKHSPKTMVKFLYQFSSNENFKWFTHRPDNAIDKINFTEKLKDYNKNFISLKLTWDLNFSTYFFIKNFFEDSSKLFETNYPTKYSSKYNYANQLIKDKIALGISPFDIDIEGEYFSNTIKIFKNSIEFRLDKKEYKFDYVFRNFITNNISIDLKEKYGNNFDKIAKSLTAYIDVNNFYRGLKVIIDWLNDYKLLSNNVEIELQNFDDYYELSIFHINSYFQTDPYSTKFNGNSGNLEMLRKYWFSIVDWDIEADCFYDGKTESYNFICLNENTELIDNKPTGNIIEKLGDNVGGVKHKIKIYKTINL